MAIANRRRLGKGLAALVTGAALLAGCGAGGPTADPDATGPLITGTPVGLPRPAHTVVLILENKSADQVIGSSAAPFLTGLANGGAYFTNSHGVAHPSQPNYIALFSGATHGVTGDACPQQLGAAPNLASQLDAAGKTFVGYAEGLPQPDYVGCNHGDYARKHAPWANFTGLPAGTAQPFTSFPTDLGQLPDVAFVVPNLCNDMHNCPVRTGDSWARAHLDRYVTWARTHDSLLVITFDEDDGGKGNHIATVLAGAMVRPGRYGQLIDHYNVLRTLEDMYGLAPLRLARRAKPLTGWWRG